MAAPAVDPKTVWRRANRERANKWMREWRASRPAESREIRQRGYEKRKDLLIKLKSKPCHDCRQSFPHYVMDFDHTRGKKLFGIAHGIHNRTLEAVLGEIKKCDLVCANCHRVRTYTRNMQ
jgi:hypothetical protein